MTNLRAGRGAGHVVAATILLNRLAALGAGLGVRSQPIVRLTVPRHLVTPHLPPVRHHAICFKMQF